MGRSSKIQGKLNHHINHRSPSSSWQRWQFSRVLPWQTMADTHHTHLANRGHPRVTRTTHTLPVFFCICLFLLFVFVSLQQRGTRPSWPSGDATQDDQAHPGPAFNHHHHYHHHHHHHYHHCHHHHGEAAHPASWYHPGWPGPPNHQPRSGNSWAHLSWIWRKQGALIGQSVLSASYIIIYALDKMSICIGHRLLLHNERFNGLCYKNMATGNIFKEFTELQ